MSILQIMRFEMVFKIFITFLTVVCYDHKVQFSAVGIEISCFCERKIEEGEVYNGKGIKLAVVQIKFYKLDTHHLHFFGFNLNSFQCYTVFILLFILF